MGKVKKLAGRVKNDSATVDSNIQIKSVFDDVKTELLDCSCKDRSTVKSDPSFQCNSCDVAVKTECNSYHSAKRMKLELISEKERSLITEDIPPSSIEKQPDSNETTQQNSISTELPSELQTHLKVLLANQKRVSKEPSDSPNLIRLHPDYPNQNQIEACVKKVGNKKNDSMEKDVEIEFVKEVKKDRFTSFIREEKKGRNHKRNVYDCELCRFTTRNKLNLRLHINTKHSRDKPWKCHFDSGSLNTLLIHEQCHVRKRRYTCRFCDYSTHSIVQLNYHSNGHTNTGALRCSNCNYTTYDAYKFNEHYNKCNNQEVQVTNTTSPTPRKWKCRRCTPMKPCRKFLDHEHNHQDMQRNKTSNVTASASRPGRIVQLLRNDHNYTSASKPSREVRLIHVDRNYASFAKPGTKEHPVVKICSKCDFSSSFPDVLIEHYRNHHVTQIQQNVFDMLIADLLSKQQPSVKNSNVQKSKTKKVNTKKANAKIDHNYTSATKPGSNPPTKGHLAIRVCTKCDFSSCFPDVLIEHYRSHHVTQVQQNKFDMLMADLLSRKQPSVQKSINVQKANVPEANVPKAKTKKVNEANKTKTVPIQSKTDKPETKFNCELCDFSACIIGLVNLHMKEEHSQRKCKICDFTANTSKLMNQHMKKEHVVNKCPKCDFRSYYLDDFNEHMLTHMQNPLRDAEKQPSVQKSVVKIWQCDKCDYSSDFESIFKVHQQIHVTERLCKEFQQL